MKKIILSTFIAASLLSGLAVNNAQAQDVTSVNVIGAQEVKRQTLYVKENSTTSMGGNFYTYDLYDTTGGPWSITSDGKLTNQGTGSAYLDLYHNGEIALRYWVRTYK